MEARQALEKWCDYVASQILADQYEVLPADSIAIDGVEHLDLDGTTADALISLSR